MAAYYLLIRDVEPNKEGLEVKNSGLTSEVKLIHNSEDFIDSRQMSIELVVQDLINQPERRHKEFFRSSFHLFFFQFRQQILNEDLLQLLDLGSFVQIDEDILDIFPTQQEIIAVTGYFSIIKFVQVLDRPPILLIHVSFDDFGDLFLMTFLLPKVLLFALLSDHLSEQNEDTFLLEVG